jgi:hypothetical protein
LEGESLGEEEGVRMERGKARDKGWRGLSLANIWHGPNIRGKIEKTVYTKT